MTRREAPRSTSVRVTPFRPQLESRSPDAPSATPELRANAIAKRSTRRISPRVREKRKGLVKRLYATEKQFGARLILGGLGLLRPGDALSSVREWVFGRHSWWCTVPPAKLEIAYVDVLLGVGCGFNALDVVDPAPTWCLKFDAPPSISP
jgi:hypothetical protein